jgi:AAA15 family ATPase/GTPase
MLNSLNIKNYRNLKELRINSLGRVNLITGKNNTGKSTILEAIALFASKGDLALIYQFLSERGENFRQTENNKNSTDINIRSLSSLFTNRMISFDREDAIVIGSTENTLFGEDTSNDNSLSIRFVKYLDEIQRDNQGATITRKRTLIEKDENGLLENYKIGIEIRIGKSYSIIPIEEDRPYRFGFKGLSSNESYQFIRTRNIDKEINGNLFDNITLTEKEQFIIDALKIIEPTTERIAFIGENSRERTAVIKLANISTPLPLRSMGDGVNRILTIILALVNSDNGFLLIDEFENGLHHTVQEKLWNVIFKLAESLKIQVFVTTHSEDCISGFENILNNPENKLDGKLIRLDNINGEIHQVEFNANELKIATDLNIETR